jgi:hypothetical protein
MASQTQTDQVPIPRLDTNVKELSALIKQLNDILLRHESQNTAFQNDIAQLISRTNSHGI